MDELAKGAFIAGRYKVVRLLGKGTAKQVYLADDRLTGEQVALALLKPGGHVDETVTARFQREGRIGSALQSPYIVRVRDEGLLDHSTHYLVAEAVIGRSLEDVVAGGSIAPDIATRWILQVLSALSEAHRLGIVHRDVKPENVLLARAAEGEIAKLTDFGIAKLLDTSVESVLTVQTAANVMLGTPQYMSPEQWQGMAIDSRADLYATGVMFYELLVGNYPFDAYSLEALFMAHLEVAPKPFPDGAPALLRALEPVIMRSLEKEADRRFPSADAMREAIEVATGIHLYDDSGGPELVYPARFSRVELLSALWPSPIQLIMSPKVILGRGDAAHLSVRCLPESAENHALTKMISHEHAVVDWRGGRARIADLGSKSRTWVHDVPIGSEPVELYDGDEVAIGSHARMRFEHARVSMGELPKWARFTRVDEFGDGRQHILVLTDATASAYDDAAIRIPAELCGDQSVRFHVGAEGLLLESPGSTPQPLHDGQQVHLGRLEMWVMIED